MCYNIKSIKNECYLLSFWSFYFFYYLWWSADNGGGSGDSNRGELNIALNAQTLTLDLQMTTATATRDFAWLMFESLMDKKYSNKKWIYKG